jgi:hypothetical protein
MKSLMQQALGADWEKLPPALQAHYRFGATVDTGSMDIEFPRFMQPVWSILKLFGALVDRKGNGVMTIVEKSVVGERQVWRRTITYADGQVVRFDSFWVAAGNGQVIEFVNPVLGLQMVPYMVGDKLHYCGVRFVAKLGPVTISIPEWLTLGHATIVEEALDDTHFAMDFRLTHPWFGQLFRYSGKFEAASR